MTEHLETWHCPECGGTQFYWHFDAQDGYGLIAVLGQMPDMSSMESAKAKLWPTTREKQMGRDLRTRAEQERDAALADLASTREALRELVEAVEGYIAISVAVNTARIRDTEVRAALATARRHLGERDG